MKTKIEFNIWDYIDAEDINQLVDEKAKKSKAKHPKHCICDECVEP
jgi:hypothetical protein